MEFIQIQTVFFLFFCSFFSSFKKHIFSLVSSFPNKKKPKVKQGRLNTKKFFIYLFVFFYRNTRSDWLAWETARQPIEQVVFALDV